MKDVTQAVLSEQKEEKKEIYKPYVSNSVIKKIGYYEKDATDEEKENSLIVYEKTYMPSSGIFYESEEKKAVDGGYFNNIIYICKNYET